MSTSPTTRDLGAIRSQLIEFLRGGSAHADARTVLANVPEAHYGARPTGAPHTPWQLLFHLQFTLRDLLDFCTDANYVAPEWPEDYWPAADTQADERGWKATEASFVADLAAFEALIEDPSTDLEAPIAWGQGQTILREVLLAIDHTSYHLGQMVILRRQLGDWQE